MQVARLFAFSILFVFGLLIIWMNRYHYDEHIPYHIVRISRFSGQICYSQPDGTWNSKLTPPDKSALSSSNEKEVNPFSVSAASESQKNGCE